MAVRARCPGRAGEPEPGNPDGGDPGGVMSVSNEGDRLRAENETLRARLSSLTEAILRISENLDLDTVLYEVVDSARNLTQARGSMIFTHGEAGGHQDLVVRGLTDEQSERVAQYPQGMAFLEYLTKQPQPLRTNDLAAYAEEAGFPGFPIDVGACLGAQIRVGDKHLGNIYITKGIPGEEFSPEDEETLEMFATQAALAITNARRYGDEQRAKADLEALVDTSPVGVLVLDALTKEVLKINNEACHLIGFRSQDGHNRARALENVEFRRIDGSAVPADEVPYERSARSGEIVRAEELVIVLPSGDEVTTLINTTPIQPDEDQHVVVTIQDMTALEELERLRADFLGMVSHELRTPLTSIKGSAATVLGASSPLDPAETRQFFRIIEDQADHMRDLINNLLDLTRIEAGTLSVATVPTDVASVIEQARNAFLSSGYRNSIEIDVAPNLPRVAADVQRIIQVLHNLFANASMYSRDWSPIRVAARLDGTHVAVSVVDEGEGIAGKHLPLLFTKFSRIDPEKDQRVAGHGLGLAICRGIVEAHGGRIRAESDGVGSGTRFIFTIPAVTGNLLEGPHYDADSSADSEQEQRQRDRILVVDDDPQILRYVRNTLAEAGYHPVVTGEVAEASDLIRSGQPQLVLLNLVLPGVNGFELLRRIRADSQVPVIVLSGRGGGRDIAKAFDLGAADYVVKPFSPDELVARVGAALRQAAAYPHSGFDPFVYGDLSINHLERRVTVAGKPIHLTPTEYRLLFELARHSGRVLTHDQLMSRVWVEGRSADQRLLRSFIKNLRHKLGDNARKPTYIFTQSGFGYRFANLEQDDR